MPRSRKLAYEIRHDRRMRQVSTVTGIGYAGQLTVGKSFGESLGGGPLVGSRLAAIADGDRDGYSGRVEDRSVREIREVGL